MTARLSMSVREPTSTDQSPAAWAPMFHDLVREHGFEELEVEGRLPASLRGTLYRAGPARFSNHGVPYQHIFDGDGGVCALRIADGRAQAAHRLVQSAALRAEARAGKMRYGGFATRVPGYAWQALRKTFRNSANTNVIPWQGKLLALFEAGLPTMLDSDLHTLGTTDLGGMIPQTFSAHPHRVASRKTLYNFGLRLGFRPRIDLYALPDAGQPRHLTSIPLPGRLWLHDFTLTQNHALFFVSPISTRLWSVLLGSASFAEALHWRPEQGTEVIVVGLDAPHRVRRFKVEPFYQWHFANAFEASDGQLHVDFIRYADFGTLTWLEGIRHGPTDRAAPGFFCRARIDVPGERLEWQQLNPRPVEFPRVAPSVEGAAYRYAWCAAHANVDATRQGMQDRILKLDVQSGAERVWAAGPGAYVGEPVFVPEGTREDEGWLLVMVWDSQRQRSCLAVLDAAHPERGPRARMWFPGPVPVSFHGSWLPGA